MLALCRAGFIALVACAVTLQTARAIEPKYIPANSQIVFGVNVKQIIGSEVVKGQKDVLDQVKAALENKLEDNKRPKEFLDKIGFDPLKDLDQVIVAHPGTKEGETYTVVLVGRFDADKVHGAVADYAKNMPDVITIGKLGKTPTYEITPPGQKTFHVALVSQNALVISPDKDAFRDVVARSTGLMRPTMKKEMVSLMRTINDKQSMSLAISGTALASLSDGARIPNAQMVLPIIQSLSGITGAVTMSKDIHFQLAIGAQDAETAKKILEGGNAGLMFLQFMVTQKAMEDDKLAPAVEVLKTVRVTAQGNNTILSGNISYANLDKLIKNYNRLPQQ